MGFRRFLIGFAVLIVLLIVTLTVAANFYTEYQWFLNLGYSSVFVSMLLSRLAVGAAVGLAFTLFILVNLVIARRVKPSPFRIAGSGVVEEIQLPSNLTPFVIGIPVAVGLLTGIAGSNQWMVVRQHLAAVPFGMADPFLGQDIGFFLFNLPFLMLLYQLAFSLLVVTTMIIGFYYVISGSVTWTGRLSIGQYARTHLFLLAAAMLALKAFGYRLGIYNLLYSPRGVAFGASYTDIHAQLPALRVLTVVALLAAALAIVNIKSRGFRWIGMGLGLLLATSLAMGSLYPGFIQNFQVSPDEISKETPFMIENIKHTNIAYGLDGVLEQQFPAESVLTLDDVMAAGATLKNVRLWDHRALKDTFRQLQEMRPYYHFEDVDSGRYILDGEIRHVFLSARELNTGRLPESARTWVNIHLKFTHGYGLAMAPGSEVSSEGLPVFFVKDFPPQAIGGISVTRPEIYYGEMTNDYVVVNTREPEFSYPLGESNVMTHYEGTGGVRVGNLLNRLLLSMRVGSYRVLLTDAITPDSRIMFNRQITERVRTLAPFLRYDNDPYLVVSDDGRLFWIIDAYTVSRAFPYSEPYGGDLNYIRNSVKVVVDAYQGSVDYYVFDEEDTILQTYRQIFPGLFKSRDEMPADLRAHTRYPLDLFRMQSEMLSTYHMRDAGVFYNKEDQWTIPTEAYAGNIIRMEPYYTIMTLPGQEEPEFLLMLPFTPAHRQNMVAWLAARNDEPYYGELHLYRFPRGRVVFGPMQIEARIDQDAYISQQLTLWGQAGSDVIRGNLLVIPINSSIMYIEPLFLQSPESRIPEFRRVIVGYGDRIVMESDLETALAVLFGVRDPEAPGVPIDGEILTIQELVERAARFYLEAETAAREGRWSEYGRALEELGRVLESLDGMMQEVVE